MINAGKFKAKVASWKTSKKAHSIVEVHAFRHDSVKTYKRGYFDV